MSRLVGKQTICIGENKDADQLRGNREADQRLCFHYMESTIPLLSESKISRLQPSSVLVQLCLCQTWSETTLLAFPRDVSYIVQFFNIILYEQDNFKLSGAAKPFEAFMSDIFIKLVLSGHTMKKPCF